MVVFAIPLRSKESTKNWGGVVERFHLTLQSIFNQKNSDSFKCIVACNEIPKLSEQYDERLEFICMDLPTPSGWLEMARDKFWKLTAIAVRIREILEQQEDPDKGIYVMPVDADDLLSNQIAHWCEMYPDENGAVSKVGYVWNGKSKYMKMYQEIYTFCGSCNIIKMYRDDLPDTMPYDNSFCHDKEVAGVLNARYPIRYDHNIVFEKYKRMGKPFKYLPFRSTIYVRGLSENISMIGVKNKHDRFHPVAFLRSLNIFQYKWITQRVKDEFGIKSINE